MKLDIKNKFIPFYNKTCNTLQNLYINTTIKFSTFVCLKILHPLLEKATKSHVEKNELNNFAKFQNELNNLPWGVGNRSGEFKSKGKYYDDLLNKYDILTAETGLNSQDLISTIIVPLVETTCSPTIKVKPITTSDNPIKDTEIFDKIDELFKTKPIKKSSKPKSTLKTKTKQSNPKRK